MSETTDACDGPQLIAAADFRGLRLGRCARRILLLAPSPLEEPTVVPPGRAHRTAAESHRRAMRSLAASGLIELVWKTEIVETRQIRRAPHVRWDPIAGIFRDGGGSPTYVERAIKRRAVRLTLLGERVVDRLRPALENGRRIRWESIDELDGR